MNYFTEALPSIFGGRVPSRAIYVGPEAGAKEKGNVLGRVFEHMNAIRNDTETTAKVIRCVGYISIFVEQYFNKTTNALSFLNSKLLENADLIDSVHFIRDVKYWNAKEYEKNKDPLVIRIANAVFVGVSSSCLVCLLDDMKFINLSRIAASIGNSVPLLKSICELTPNEVIRSQLTVGFGLLLYQTCVNKADNEAKVRQRRIDIAQFVSQVALNAIYTFCGPTTTIPIAVLGAFAQGMGVVSFAHHFAYKNDLSNKKEKPPINEKVK